MESFDYVIVGAGSAGCVLANRLSADPSVSVLVLEGGPKDSSPLIDMPRGMGKMHKPGNPNVKFYTASKGGNRPDEVWFKGTTLGGSSSVNGMVYVRGAPFDYDGWEAAGCAGWGWKDMGACFAELEDHELGADKEAVRGAGGPLKVSIEAYRNGLTEAVLQAGEAMGVPRVADINAPSAVRDGGLGYMTRTINKGRRWSASAAFLKPVLSRSNLHIATETTALKIVFEGRKVTGIRVRDAGGERSIGVGRELILAAGAIESPKLLQLSGIGPAPLLKSLGVEMVVDAPDVGQNLREHRYLPVSFKVREGSLNSAFRGIGLVGSLLRYYLFHIGPMTNAAHEVAGFIKSRPHLDHCDVQLGIGLYTMRLGPKGYEIDDQPGFTIGGYYTRPQSRGEVRITANDPDAAPFINANYLDTEEDRAGSIAMAHWIRRMAAQPSLKSFILSERSPGDAVKTDDEVLQALIERGSTSFHVSSTCRMGADAGSVVDPELKVRGVEGLRVCDTSIFPSLVSGNTNAPAMATGLRLAKMMTGQG